VGRVMAGLCLVGLWSADRGVCIAVVVDSMYLLFLRS